VLFQLLIRNSQSKTCSYYSTHYPKYPIYPIRNTHTHSRISTSPFTPYRTQSNFTRPASIAGDLLAFTSQYRTRPPACDKVRLLTVRPPPTYHLRLIPVSSPPGLQPTGANSNTSQHFYLKSTSTSFLPPITSLFYLFILFYAIPLFTTGFSSLLLFIISRFHSFFDFRCRIPESLKSQARQVGRDTGFKWVDSLSPLVNQSYLIKFKGITTSHNTTTTPPLLHHHPTHHDYHLRVRLSGT
jgi:hypothetical protein